MALGAAAVVYAGIHASTGKAGDNVGRCIGEISTGRASCSAPTDEGGIPAAVRSAQTGSPPPATASEPSGASLVGTAPPGGALATSGDGRSFGARAAGVGAMFGGYAAGTVVVASDVASSLLSLPALAVWGAVRFLGAPVETTKAAYRFTAREIEGLKNDFGGSFRRVWLEPAKERLARDRASCAVASFQCGLNTMQTAGHVSLATVPAAMQARAAWALWHGQRAVAAGRTGAATTAERRADLGKASATAGTGAYVNLYHRTPELYSHVVVRNTDRPRILVANSAGNSAFGIWANRFADGGRYEVTGGLRQVTSGDGVPGVEFKVTGPSRWETNQVLMDTMRGARDHEHGSIGVGPGVSERQATANAAARALEQVGPLPNAADEARRVQMIQDLDQWYSPRRVVDPSRPDVVAFERNEAGGQRARYRVEFVPDAGTTVAATGQAANVTVSGNGQTSVTVRAFLDRPAVAPLDDTAWMTDGLRMLSSKEGPNAGSPFYMTPFARDAIVSTDFLGDAASVEFGMSTTRWVLRGVNDKGEMTHEPSIGGQATIQNLPELVKHVREHQTLSAQEVANLERQVNDHKMADLEMLFPPFLARFVPRLSPAQVAATFDADGVAALGRVFARVDDLTSVRTPDGKIEFIGLKPGQVVGNWRDSEEGLGAHRSNLPETAGQFPLDINAYLAPATLRGIASLARSPNFPTERLLAAAGPRRPQLERMLADPRALEARADAWERAASDAFRVTIEGADARARLNAFMDRQPAEFREALGDQVLFGSNQTVREALAGPSEALDHGVSFPALARTTSGKPVEVLSTDLADHLFYGNPSRAELVSLVRTAFQPYPIGSMTPVGPVVANAAYSKRPTDPETFGHGRYHSDVIWGREMVMWQKGLEKQLKRFGDDAEVTGLLNAALGTLRAAKERAGALAGDELWSWTVQRPAPAGSSSGGAMAWVQSKLPSWLGGGNGSPSPDARAQVVSDKFRCPHGTETCAPQLWTEAGEEMPGTPGR